MKKTVVIGASDNPERVSHQVVGRLQSRGHEVVPVGIKEGEINGLKIIKGKPAIADVDTVTLYVGPKNQPEWIDYILSLKPKRVIFNPGTENPEFETILKKNKIETEVACTLVMLSIGNY
ncbi:MAG: CoA-binding protein [Bacteroidota bacterium]